jgi:hypothetical protein
MGLDWLVSPKTKDGFEEQRKLLESVIQKFQNKILEIDDAIMKKKLENELEKLNKKFFEITISKYETVKCKRIGIDKEANEYILKRHLQKNSDEKSHELLLRDIQIMYGMPIPELYEDKDGLAAYSGIATSDFDFRGKVLSDTILSKELKDEMYEKHDAKETLEFAKKFQNYIDDYYENNKNLYKSREEFNNSYSVEPIVKAIQWLTYWGGKGHGFDPWY